MVEVDGGKAKKTPDFKFLADQMKSVNPKGVEMDKYKPSSTTLRSCPDNKVWKSNKVLPPTPNKELCGCMVKSLTCTAKDSIDDEDLGDLFGTVCGLSKTACAGIQADAEEGKYGAYSMCNPREKLSFAMNSYYEEQNSKGNGANACDFDGKARKQSPVKPTGTCSKLIEQAGKDGTGSITSVPNSSSSSAASPMVVPSISKNLVHLAAYLFCATLAGAGMILL